MSTDPSHETITIDRLDRQIIHALQSDGRASFSRIAEVLGSSEQTVARRFRRLREAGVVQVVAIPETDRAGMGWMVRIQLQPASATSFAELISRRDDVSWVSMTAGGTEVVCSVRPRTREERDRMLLDRLPRTAQVIAMAPLAIMRPFVTTTSEWGAFGDPLTAEQAAALAPDGSTRSRRRTAGVDVAALGSEPTDAKLLTALRRDGRASYADLAQATGLTPAQAARRFDALLDSGRVYLDVDIAHELLGFPVAAMLWITVAPGDLEEVGSLVAEHDESAFVAAISGNANLFAGVRCRDVDELYRYVTRQLGSLPGIRGVEVSPVLRNVKQAGAIMDGPRLPDPLRR
ncbi:MAG: Lrp/AsnC family transcriptional regulator [Patulibacter sp.]|nr:Lrp/AsnC family transcriptional regulator [Patulibacter sp.]